MNKRLEELDSLRGLAAIAVMFLHMYEILPGNYLSKLLFEFGPLRLIISGGESVVLFFVLSGFVLSKPFYTNKQIGYFSFITKRICRIYIPYILAIFVAFICREMFYMESISNVSEWANSFWKQPVNIEVIKEHILLVDTFLSNIDPVVWSLVHEMRISLIFPLLMFLLVRVNFKIGIVLSVLLTIISILGFYIFRPADTGTEHIITIHYTAMFVIGALLAKYTPRIKNILISLSKMARVAIFSFGVMIYVYIHPSFVIKHFLFSNINPFYRTVIDSWSVTVGASIIIMIALSSRSLSSILRNKLITFLGKISYSLYLIHVVILFTCLRALYNLMPIWSIYLIALVLIFTVSSIMYILIEKPSIKLGKILTQSNSKTQIDQKMIVNQAR